MIFWYPYDVSGKEFPLLGSSSKEAHGWSGFRRKDFDKELPNVFPAYYEGKWFNRRFYAKLDKSSEHDENGDINLMAEIPSRRRHLALSLNNGFWSGRGAV